MPLRHRGQPLDLSAHFAATFLHAVSPGADGCSLVLCEKSDFFLPLLSFSSKEGQVEIEALIIHSTVDII